MKRRSRTLSATWGALLLVCIIHSPSIGEEIAIGTTTVEHKDGGRSVFSITIRGVSACENCWLLVDIRQRSTEMVKITQMPTPIEKHPTERHGFAEFEVFGLAAGRYALRSEVHSSSYGVPDEDSLMGARVAGFVVEDSKEFDVGEAQDKGIRDDEPQSQQEDTATESGSGLLSSALCESISEDLDEEDCEEILESIEGPEPVGGQRECFAMLFPPSFQHLMDERSPCGRCYFTATLCSKHNHLSGRLVDDSRYAYERLDVGNSEESCLGRAKAYWEWCGNAENYPTAMIFAPTGASSTHPPEELVEDHLVEAISQVLAKSPDHKYRLRSAEPEIRYTQEHRPLDEMPSELAAIPAHAPSGWKTVSVFVQGSLYGQRKAWNGQYQQDRWVMDVFEGKTGGYFIDLAAYDAVQWSNTLTLEQDFGWEGLCIEANAGRLWGLSHRRCHVVQALVGSDSGEHLTFTSSGTCGDGCAGIVGVGFDNNHAIGKSVRMPTVPVRKVLKDFEAPQTIDYLSLDVEGAEDLVLSSFPFDTHTVLVISIERPTKYAVDTLKDRGFLYLRSLPPFKLRADDEMWVHSSLPNVHNVLATLGNPEPEVREHWVKPA